MLVGAAGIACKRESAREWSGPPPRTAEPAPGPDRDCRHFDTWEAAQAFFLRHGGPERDPHRLDADGDGIACEWLR